ncbi:hypothetical protein [Streptomyces caniscabiei]|uniref:hypothetical protein n=1 Tax=Streptomyces caniscabiei TaxID=2746961 RepID=UPI000A374F80|nr:hypothetical protein [Streptomyces caniscabiei]
MTIYRAVLRFHADGPAAIGEWTVDTTPLQVYRQWVGIYGSDPAVIIEVTEENEDRQRVLRTWEQGAEALRAER